MSATGFSMLVVLESAGGSLELRTLRQRLGLSKANATEVTATLEAARPGRARAAARATGRARDVRLTPAGERRCSRTLFPGHARRVRDAFTPLDDDEKRELARLCRKLDRAA